MPTIDQNKKAHGALVAMGLFFAVRKSISFYNVDALVDKASGCEPGDVFEVKERECGTSGKEGLVEDLMGAITRGRITPHKTAKEAEAAAKGYAADHAAKEEEATKQAAVGGDVLGLIQWQGDKIAELEAKVNAIEGGGTIEGENPSLAAEFKAIKDRLDAIEESGSGALAAEVVALKDALAVAVKDTNAILDGILPRLGDVENNIVNALDAVAELSDDTGGGGSDTPDADTSQGGGNGGQGGGQGGGRNRNKK